VELIQRIQKSVHLLEMAVVHDALARVLQDIPLRLASGAQVSSHSS
jgi:hypothetical protein